MKTKNQGHETRHDENQARLARIEGQLRGVRRMVEQGAYCMDILNQVQAIRAALQSVSRRILRKHLEHCVADAMRGGDPSDVENNIEELLSAIRRMEM